MERLATGWRDHGVLPEASWSAAGSRADQARMMDRALARGAQPARTVLEDNIHFSRDHLGASNKELVRLTVEASAPLGCRPAAPTEACGMLGLCVA